MRSLSACCTLLLATLLTGCGSSSAPPTLKSGPELVLVTNLWHPHWSTVHRVGVVPEL